MPRARARRTEAASAPRLRLALLGGFRAEAGGGAPIALPTRKAEAVVAYLSLPLGRAHPRPRLASLLWPDMPGPQAQGNLRHTLSRIRTALPEAARAGLLLDGATVALDAARVDVDAARFERLIADGAPAALEQAAALYRGELLAGLALSEEPFEAWLGGERRRLHDLAVRALSGLLDHQQAAGDAEPAIRTGLRLLALDPLQEPVHRAVMRLYAGIGRREAALRQYELCARTLRRELHSPPEPETAALYQQIRHARAARVEAVEPAADGAREPRGRRPVAPAPHPVEPAAVGAREPRDRGPAGTATAAATNLPAATSELIGRSDAVEELRGLLGADRLVTLVGAGGVGKTRLALEVARRELAVHADGVWLAELAPLADAALVPVTVAVALGLPTPSGSERARRVAAALADRRLLLVLDNCEHVVEAAAEMATALLRANPHARVLATSREPLRAPDERVYRVPSLAVPAEGAREHEDVASAAAVRLFAARARAMDRRFTLDARGAELAGAICRRLDGIPLAIELAAARATALGLPAVADHLDDRFHLLTAGHRTALPRHQTLRATLDWSHELLPAPERAILRRLGVFAGAFGLLAAEAVAAGDGLADAEVDAGLDALVAKSLVSAEPGEEATARYRLLETTRAYALEKLRESGELDRVSRRHAEHWRDLFERAEAEWAAGPAREWPPEHRRHLDNVRTALDWAFSPGGDAAVGAALAAAAVPLWTHLSLMTECCARVERAVAGIGVGMAPDARRDMRLHLALGTALLHTSRLGGAEMTAALSRALELAEQLGDAEYILRALYELYLCRVLVRDYRGALAMAERFVGAASRSADPADAIIGGRLIGTVRHVLGEHAAARRHIEPLAGADLAARRRSLIVRYQFDQRVVAHAFLARILWIEGRPEQALRMAGDTVDYARGEDHRVSLFYALIQAACPIAIHAAEIGRAERFTAMLRELAVAQSLETWRVWARCFEASLLIRRGESAAGARQLRAALGELPEVAFQLHLTPFLGELAAGLGAAGQVADGLAVVEDALQRADRAEERWIVPELLRHRAGLVLLAGASTAEMEAEADLTRALDEARGQGALAWELRAATALASVWQRQDKAGAAGAMLAAVCDRFSEGFDTPDLAIARALIDRLE